MAVRGRSQSQVGRAENVQHGFFRARPESAQGPDMGVVMRRLVSPALACALVASACVTDLDFGDSPTDSSTSTGTSGPSPTSETTDVAETEAPDTTDTTGTTVGPTTSTTESETTTTAVATGTEDTGTDETGEELKVCSQPHEEIAFGFSDGQEDDFTDYVVHLGEACTVASQVRTRDGDYTLRLSCTSAEHGAHEHEFWFGLPESVDPTLEDLAYELNFARVVFIDLPRVHFVRLVDPSGDVVLAYHRAASGVAEVDVPLLFAPLTFALNEPECGPQPFEPVEQGRMFIQIDCQFQTQRRELSFGDGREETAVFDDASGALGQLQLLVASARTSIAQPDYCNGSSYSRDWISFFAY